MKHHFTYYIFLFIISSSIALSQATFISVTNGNWSDNGTWLKISGVDEDLIPDANDTVRIATIQTDTVTILSGTDDACATLEIGSLFSTGGLLKFSGSTSSLTVEKCTIFQSPDTLTRKIDVGSGIFSITNNLTFEATDGNADHNTILSLTTGTLTVNGNIIFDASNASNAVLDLSGACQVNLGGAIILNSLGTISTNGSGSTFNYNGINSQVVVVDIPGFVYENLYINNSSLNGAVLNGNITPFNVTGDLKIKQGTLKTASFSITGNPGKQLSVDSGGTIVLGENSTTQGFPTGFGTVNLNAYSTVKYMGGNQNVTNLSGGYGNLTLETGSGNSTKTLPASILTIVGNFTVQAGNGSLITTTASNNLVIGKNVSIGTGAIVGFGNFSHTVGGDWINSGGLYAPGQSTITFNGNIPQSIAGPTFYNLILSGTGQKNATASLAISGTVTINNGTTFNGSDFNHSIQKDWVNNGTFTSTGKVTFNGSTPQSITATNFYSLAFSNGGLKTPTAGFSVSSDFTINSGATFSGNGFAYSIGGSWQNNGTFTFSGSKITFNGTDTQYVYGGTFDTLIINKASGLIILSSEALIQSNFSLLSGIFDAQDNYIDRISSGGTLTMGPNTTFRLGGFDPFPTKFSTLSLSNSSIIEYSGADQLLKLSSYKNLTVSGSGVKSFQQNTSISGNVTVQSGATLDPELNSITGSGTSVLDNFGTLRIPLTTLSSNFFNFSSISLKTGNTVEYSGSNQTIDSTLSYYSLAFSGSGTKTLHNALSLSGGITINGVTLNGGSFSHSLGGNWSVINNGVFLTSGTVTFNATGQVNGNSQTISKATFNNLVLSGNGVKHISGNLTIAGTLTVSSGVTMDAGNSSHSVNGNVTINGTIKDSLSSFTLSGISTQLLAGGKFHNLVINNNAGVSLTKSISVGDSLRILSGTLTTNADSVTLDSTGTLLESSGKVVVGIIRTVRNVLQNVTNTFGNIGFEINARNAAPRLTTVVRKTGTALAGSGVFSSHSSILRYFDVTPSTNTNLNAQFIFHYDYSETNSESEDNFSIWRSLINGSSWARVKSTVDTTTKTLTVDSVASFSRFTVADSVNVLTPVSVTVRAYSDPDGNINSTATWAKKRWNLQILADSINGTLLSEVTDDSVVSLANLTERVYYAVEADSVNWLHLGYRIDHLTSTVDTIKRYVRIDALGGESHFVDFINFKPNSISIDCVEDIDLDFTTDNDRVEKNWKVWLYKTSVSPANLIDSLSSGSSFDKDKLPDGIYVIKEADSTNWSHLGRVVDTLSTLSNLNQVSINLFGGISKSVTLVNKHPSKIIIKSYRDKDGDTLTSSDIIAKKWNLKLYVDSVSESKLIKSVSSDSILNSGELGPGKYFCYQTDSVGNWVTIAVVHDSVFITRNTNIDTFQISTGGESHTAKFIKYNPNNITIKAFEDLDGDINTDSDRVVQKWNLKLYKDSVKASELIQEVASDTLISLSYVGDGTYYAVQSDSTSWTDLRAVVYGSPTVSLVSDTIQLVLTGGDNANLQFLHFKPENSKFRTFTQDDFNLKSVKLKVKKGNPRPLANAGNVRDTAFAKIYGKSPMVVGIVRADSAKNYGWLGIKDPPSVRGSLPHTGTARGLDSLGSKHLKPIIKGQTSMKPKQHNNHLLGELITLKINMAASDAFVTNYGLGDLVYYDSSNVSSPANSKSLRKIVSIIDTMMTYWKQYTSSPLYAEYDSAIRSVNNIFAGDIDTISTSPLKIKGVKKLSQVNFLHRVTQRPDEDLIIPYTPLSYPTTYELYHNYPNPFNPVTTIPFRMVDDGRVTIIIYNILGKEVARAANNEFFIQGEQEIEFDASSLSSGVYFYHMLVNGSTFTKTQKMILLK